VFFLITEVTYIQQVELGQSVKTVEVDTTDDDDLAVAIRESAGCN
jgi:hypothetical protein